MEGSSTVYHCVRNFTFYINAIGKLCTMTDETVPKSIKEIMASVPEYAVLEHSGSGFMIAWGEPGCGFGQLWFYNKNGVTRIENEYMSKEFIKRMLCRMVDDATLDDVRENLNDGI